MPRYYVDGLTASGSVKSLVVEEADPEAARLKVSRSGTLDVRGVRPAPDGLATYTVEAVGGDGEPQTVRVSSLSIESARQWCRSRGLEPRAVRSILVPSAAPGDGSFAPDPAADHRPRTSAVPTDLAAEVRACLDLWEEWGDGGLLVDPFDRIAPGLMEVHDSAKALRLLAAAALVEGVYVALASALVSLDDAPESVRSATLVIAGDMASALPAYRRFGATAARRRPAGPNAAELFEHANPTATPKLTDFLQQWVKDDDYFGGSAEHAERLQALTVEACGQLDALGSVADNAGSALLDTSQRILEAVIHDDRHVTWREFREVSHQRRLRAAAAARRDELAVDRALGTDPAGHGEPGATNPFVETAMGELNRLVGLQGIKEEVARFAATLHVRRQQAAAGLAAAAAPSANHFVFYGNPGTGKTTVARILGRLLRGYGLLKRGHVVETDRAGLVAEYLGQTGPKTDAKVREALDGVLFIDEAYALGRGEAGRDSFGQQAIETLLVRMENYRDRLVVIVAGYPAEMATFVRSNPGLKGRFTRYLHFPDFSPAELFQVFTVAAEGAGYTMDDDAVAAAGAVIWNLHGARDTSFGNAREMRNLLEASLGRHAVRLAALGRPATIDELSRLTAEDIAG